MDDQNVTPLDQQEVPPSPAETPTPTTSEPAPIVPEADAPTETAVLSFTIQHEEKAAHRTGVERATIDSLRDD